MSQTKISLYDYCIQNDKQSLLNEWDTEKNGGLTPKDISNGSNKIVWWKCSKGHTWQAKVFNRSRGIGCPYCSGKRVSKGDNDLATMRPEIAAQWHPTLNGDLTPQDIAYGSNKKAWWVCEKGHEWEAAVLSRSHGSGCPYCVRNRSKMSLYDYCIQNEKQPLLDEWDIEKNGKMTPKDVSYGSHKKVWWVCKEGHEWEATILSRNHGRGCPYCSGQRVIKGVSDLATIRPEIAEQWHPTLNEDLTPDQVPAHSTKNVWWICVKGHEWQATVFSRTCMSVGCPYCAGKRLVKGANDLASAAPEIAEQWHPTLNGDLTPETTAVFSNKRVWWQCEKGHEWNTFISGRTRMNDSGCPFCDPRPRKKIKAKQIEMLKEAKKKLETQD